MMRAVMVMFSAVILLALNSDAAEPLTFRRADADCCSCAASTGSYSCTATALALGMYEGMYEGQFINFLSYTTTKRVPVVAIAAEEMRNCTGVVIHYQDSTDLFADIKSDLGYSAGAGGGPEIYDAFIMKSSWAASLTDQDLLEPMNSYISAAPGLSWAGVLPAARKLGTVQMNASSSVVMMPLDGDYWTLLQRRDLLASYGRATPQTLEQLVEAAEFFDGKDLNGDGVADYGFCGKLLGPQPWTASMFYFMVAPFLQSTATPNLYFNIDTMAPMIDNDGWREAARLLHRLSRAGYFAPKGPNTDFNKGRCAFLLALPGIAKKVILAGVSRKDEVGVVLWDAGVDATERVLTPGSTRVVQPDGSLATCDGLGKICPFEQQASTGEWINRAPFFVTGGWGASIRKSAPDTKKDIAFKFLAYMSLTANVIVPSLGGVMDAFRESHFNAAEHIAAGWTQTQFDEFQRVHSWAMGREHVTTQANVAQDLMIPGYSDYINVTLEMALLVYLTSERREDALSTLVTQVASGWNKTHDTYGGLESQLRIYRRSLGVLDLVSCPEGTYFSETSGECITVSDDNVDTEVLIICVSVFGGLVVLAIVGFALRWVVRTYQKKRELEQQSAETIIQQIKEAQAFSNELRTPFVLMRANDFVDMGELASQEELRGENKLVYFDTLVEATDFLSPHVSIFFSHQWLGWNHPDPENVQYQVMCGAINKVIERESMSPDNMSNMFVWIDYFSIPQKCAASQKLAVEQLGTLASICSYFIVVAPETFHFNTGEICNRTTYHERCWCRAEIFSHWARRGCSTFHSNSNTLHKAVTEGDEKSHGGSGSGSGSGLAQRDSAEIPSDSTTRTETDNEDIDPSNVEWAPKAEPKECSPNRTGIWTEEEITLELKRTKSVVPDELQNMFYMTDTHLEEMVPALLESDQLYTEEFLKAVSVFSGDLTCCKRCHNGGTQPCDKETLMLPMLGLYTEIYHNRNRPIVKQIYKLIGTKENRDLIFPPTFEYIFEEGQTVTKPLFGDLIQAVEAVVTAADSDPGDGRESTDAVVALGQLRPGAVRTISVYRGPHGAQKVQSIAEIGIALPVVKGRSSLRESNSHSAQMETPERFQTRSASFMEGGSPKHELARSMSSGSTMLSPSEQRKERLSKSMHGEARLRSDQVRLVVTPMTGKRQTFSEGHAADLAARRANSFGPSSSMSPLSSVSEVSDTSAPAPLVAPLAPRRSVPPQVPRLQLPLRTSAPAPLVVPLAPRQKFPTMTASEISGEQNYTTVNQLQQTKDNQDNPLYHTASELVEVLAADEQLRSSYIGITTADQY